MNYNILIAFFFGMVILAATPGPGVFASLARALSDGFGTSLYFILGLAIGDMIFLNLALWGLSFIASMLGNLFLIIRTVGGVYLIYLGLKMIRSTQFEIQTETVAKENKIQTVVSGVLLTMGNPKPILFYASVLPTIIDFNTVRIIDAVMMSVLIALVSLTVLGTYCYLASLSKKLILNNNFQKRIHLIAGSVLIIVGIFVLIP